MNEDRPKSVSDVGPRRLLRGALVASLAFHACLIGVLLAYRPWRTRPTTSESQASSDAAASHTDRPSSAQPTGSRPAATARSVPRSAAEEVEMKLHQSIAESKQRSEEKNIKELAQRIGQLNQVAGKASIDRLAVRFHDWLKTRPRAEQPAEEPLPGRFDCSTAEVFKIERERAADGRWIYRSVLLDAQGRTMETEMDPVQGEQAYRTMELLRSSPLAESLYRQMVLPLFDKMLYDPSRADSAGSPLEATDKPAAAEPATP